MSSHMMYHSIIDNRPNYVVIKFTDEDFLVHTYEFHLDNLLGIRRPDNRNANYFVLFYKNRGGETTHITFATEKEPIDELFWRFIHDDNGVEIRKHKRKYMWL